MAMPVRAQQPPDQASFVGRDAFASDGTRIGTVRRMVTNRDGMPMGLLIEVEDGIVLVPLQQVSNRAGRVILPLTQGEAEALPRLPPRN
ncbi:PRC-barrel domain-containing protein [Sabulicella glaciei]|uniref:PRC-barrel domain-containing protein n=1 Tax=Sabulicella glaciei TaxID=2984948 RepID=A0ABT3NRI6_9PROT|nr:PRC-barrel domain-containing protein [Roseococcus sp. MDT2-1-1]MCW8084776.1 PRC-barrel domain-containing protein [Roseococcus sp. MDT2-1-1]